MHCEQRVEDLLVTAVGPAGLHCIGAALFRMCSSGPPQAGPYCSKCSHKETHTKKPDDATVPHLAVNCSCKLLQAHQKIFKAALCCGLIMMTENKTKKHAAAHLIRSAAAGPSASHQPSKKGFGQAAAAAGSINANQQTNLNCVVNVVPVGCKLQPHLICINPLRDPAKQCRTAPSRALRQWPSNTQCSAVCHAWHTYV
jgi:hypothetical protein